MKRIKLKVYHSNMTFLYDYSDMKVYHYLNIEDNAFIKHLVDNDIDVCAKDQCFDKYVLTTYINVNKDTVIDDVRKVILERLEVFEIKLNGLYETFLISKFKDDRNN